MARRKRSEMPPVSLKIVGHVLSESYQRCKLFAERLKKYYGGDLREVVVQGMLEMDWTEYLGRLRRTAGGQTWASAGGAVAFVDGVYVGADRELVDRFKPVTFEIPGRKVLERLAKEEYTSRLNRGDRLFVYFELSSGGDRCGSLLFELRHDLLPDTAGRFARLSDPGNTLGYSYLGSRIHRVCRGGWLQGGEIEGRPHSARLPDESFCYEHDRRGVLSFVNGDRHSNCTQYAVTFGPAAWMDRRHVAFGRVVEGSDTLRRLESARCTYESPDRPVVVERCGVAEVGLGRHFVYHRLLMRGLTQGVPHVDPASLVELLFESLSFDLFERTGDAVKRRLHGLWLTDVLWDRLESALAEREPPRDVLDPKDRSSVLDAARYLAGLYGPPDVPDRFVLDLLRRAADRAADRSEEIADVRDIVYGLVQAIASSVFDCPASAEIVAEQLVRRLTDDGTVASDRSLCSGCAALLALGEGKTPSASSTCASDTRKKVKFEDGSADSPRAPDELSVIGYIWEALFDSLKPVTD